MRIAIVGQSGILANSLVSTLSQIKKHEILKPVSFQDLSQDGGVNVVEARPDVIIALVVDGMSVSNTDFNNCIFVINELFNRVSKLDKFPLIILMTSACQYGKVDIDDNPVSENSICKCYDSDSFASLTIDRLGLSYFHNYLLPIVRLRLFGVLGPGQSSEYEVARWASLIAQIEKGSRPSVIPVGDINLVRDFIYFREVEHAIILAIDKGIPGMAYNICSGQGISLKDILSSLLQMSKRSGINVEIDKRREDPDEPRIFIGNPLKFQLQAGWQIKRNTLNYMLTEMLEWWRKP